MVGVAASKLGPACDGVEFDLFSIELPEDYPLGRIPLIIDKKSAFD
jgi:hypothetical protein